MTIAYKDASNEMKSMFLAKWLNSTSSIVGYVPEQRWQNVLNVTVPDSSKAWCRFKITTIDSPQSTFSSCVGDVGNRRYTTEGFILIELFVPFSISNANEKGEELATVARDTFRGKKSPSGIWFKNVRIQELEPEDKLIRFNVIAEFEYDEIG